MTQKEQFINAPKGSKFLIDVLNKKKDFPNNCIFNKVKTGCGATTLALISSHNYVIAVPSKSLAINKAIWCEEKGIDVCIVKGSDNSSRGTINKYSNKTTDIDIHNYLVRNKGKSMKFIVIYDSLHRLQNLIKTKDFKLMIDEAHNLVTSAAFRPYAMNTVLNHFKSYKSFVFVTATPIDAMQLVPELREIPLVKINWHPNDIKKVNFNRHISGLNKYTLIDETILLCLDHLENRRTSNAYIFVNSVNFIINVLKELKHLKKVSPKDVKIISSDGNNNPSKYRVNLGSYEWMIESTRTPNKKITFLTSTCFEGVDLFDKNGKIYIISDGKLNHTKIDILTQLPQIAGRIRDSKLNNSIDIYTRPNTILSSLDKAGYLKKEKIKFKTDSDYLIGQKSLLGKTNELDSKIFSKLLTEEKTNPSYFKDENNEIQLNRTLISVLAHKWDILHQNYVYISTDKGIVPHDNNPHTFTDKKVNLPPDTIGLLLLGKPKKIRFEELAKLYIKNLDSSILESLNGNSTYNMPQLLKDIESLHPLIKEAYNLIGSKGIRANKYRKGAIKKAITNYKQQKEISIEEYLLRMDLIIEKWYSNEHLKEIISNTYKELKLNKIAKATDIQQYFHTKKRRKTIKGKQIQGYYIIKPKYN